MADERVNITIDIDVKDLKQVLATSGALKGLDTASNKLSRTTDRLTGAMGANRITMHQNSKGVVSYTKQLSLLERVGGMFIKRARAIMLTTIAMVAEFGVSALTLASVNALFVVGQAVMKAYNVGMQALAGTVAAFGVAAIAAAAAFKEFQAAQYQYRYKDSKEVGTALDQSGFALRSLYKDATLASFGVQGLSAAFAAVNKQTAFTPATKAALKAMADFSQASGDPQKSLAAAANFIGLMQKNKKFTAEALEAAKQISPEFEKAFKKGGYKDITKFMEDLTSGKLASDAGVAGQANAVNQTLFAQFKQSLAEGLVELSDVGTRVLEPVKKAMNDIFQGLLRTFRRVSGDLVGFGQGPFLDSLVKFTYRIEDFTVMLFRKFLPATEGFWKRVTRIFDGLRIYFYEVRDALDKLRDGGSIVIKTFGKPIVEIFKQIGKSAKGIGELAKNNRENWEKFSDAITRFVKGFFDLSRGFRTAFDAALPFISMIVKFIGQLGTAVGGLLKLGAALPGVFGMFGGAAGTAGVMALAFKGRRAARYGTRKAAEKYGAGQIPISQEDAIYSGMRLSSLGTPQEPGLSPLSGSMPGATGSMATSAAADSMGLSNQLTEAVKEADTIAKLKPKKEKKSKDGGLPGIGDALKAKTINVYGDVVNVKRGGGKGKGGSDPQYPTGSQNPRVGINPGRMQGMLNPSNTISDVGVPFIPGGYGGMAVRQMANLEEAAHRDRMEAQGMQRLYNQRGFASATPLPPTIREKMQTRFSNAREKMYSLKADRMARQLGYAPTYRERATGLAKNKWSNTKSWFKDLPSVAKMGVQSAWYGNDAVTALGSAGGGGATGAMGAGGSMKASQMYAGGGLKGQMGRFFLGQSYKPNEPLGFRKTAGRMLGVRFADSNFGQGYAAAKENAALSGQKFSKFKGLKAGLSNSLSGGGIVASLLASQGISMLQNKGVVSEEAAPGMQLGASLMSVNPMLGFAVGAGMTAMTAKTKMGGVVSGAMSGAALGSMIAGPLGAAVGGLIGAGLGWVAANRNQAKIAKEGVKKIGDQFLFQIASSALAGVSTGSTTGARMQVDRFGSLAKTFTAANSKEERAKILAPYKDMLGKNQFDLMIGDNTGDAEKQFATTAANMKAALTPAFNQFDDVMKSLMLSTGKTGDEIMSLAMEKNVNLYDSTLKLSDITAKLGVGMVRTAQQFGQALRDVQVGSMSVFNNFKKNKEMKDAIQAAGETLRGGDTSVEAFADYLQKQADFLSYKNPNSPLLNIVTQLRAFGTGSNAGTGALFQKGGALSGVTMGTETKGLVGQMADEQIKGAAFESASQLGAMLTESGFQFADADLGRRNLEIQLQTLLKRATAGDQTAIQQIGLLEEDLKRGTALKGKSATEVATYLSTRLGGSVLTGEDARMAKQGNAPGYMGTSIVSSLAGDYEKFGKALNEEAQALRQGFLDAIEDGFFKAQGTPDWWNQQPEWWANGLKIEDGKIVPADDTRTPRGGRVGDTSVSKTLGRTMSRHNYFDGMLTGKRTITSAWRNYGLGSPSSDHVTGKAYDLTGQNLGQYASLIKSAGGFAEFHGAASTRHLHVVPPAAPTGDTSTAKVAMAANGTGGQMVSSDNITINVYETQDAQATAQAVAKKLLEMQRNWKQRS